MLSQKKDKSTGIEYNCKELERLLRKKFGEELVLVNYKVDNLIALGENFGSKILKIDAKIQLSKDSKTENLYMIVKTVMDTDYEVDWTTLLRKEIFMYTHIITQYEKIEVQSGWKRGNDIKSIVPTLYGHRMSLDENRSTADQDALILLENLKVQGYYIGDKKIGLDFEHSTLTLKSLAKFHAFGLAAKRHYPSDFDLIKVQSDLVGFGSRALEVGYAGIVNLFKTNPLFEQYSDCIEAIATCRKDVWDVNPVSHEPWTTIIHGDFWTNNIMFHKDELGRLDDLKIIDFQTYRFADVFVDLVYFLGTSLNEEVFSKHFDEMIDVYYMELVSVLRDLKVDLQDFERKKFDEGFKKDAGMEILRCAVALNFFNSDVDENATEEDRLELFDKLIKCRSVSEQFSKKLLRVLQIYEEKGWLHY
ncbi:hypothetical protein TSAR_012190 [Trichomalopsis sarcophagae]|uniref:CHK kinase-like domain-containing protein n=1 Tax=Trichomalopsis sarcophagae TaxID=543379 RepID=A0A232F7B4_9HYME|nr:hypothetical protein TSAR_012190 [Trichomalopsis sarcophagae]